MDIDGRSVAQASAASFINIDKLAAWADEPPLIMGTAYDVYCWAKDNVSALVTLVAFVFCWRFLPDKTAQRYQTVPQRHAG